MTAVVSVVVAMEWKMIVERERGMSKRRIERGKSEGDKGGKAVERD